MRVHVYHWQLPRVGIGGIIAKNELMFGSISRKPGIYFSVGGSCNRGGLLMDYKKEIIEMIQKIHSESMIKFIYGCVKRAYKEERAGK